MNDEAISGPHLTEGLNNLGKLAGFFGPGADVQDAVLSGQAAMDAFMRGDIGQGLIETAYVPASLAGVLIPGSARGYREGAEALSGASSRSAGYNPPSLPQRSFHDDYPQGAEGPQGSLLTHDIDRTPLTAPVVAGRRRVGGDDEGLQRSEVGQVAEGIVDSVREVKRLPKNEVGRFRASQGFVIETPDGQRRRLTIETLRNLTPEEKAVVFPHEVGHAIHYVARGKTALTVRDVRPCKDQFQRPFGELGGHRSHRAFRA